MPYGASMGARKKPAKKAIRRARNDGGLYQKNTTKLDPRTGRLVPYSYWQASRDVAPENLPPVSIESASPELAPLPQLPSLG